MNMWDAGACAVALAGASPLASVPATSEKWGFLGMLIYGRGDSCYVNRQVSTYS